MRRAAWIISVVLIAALILPLGDVSGSGPQTDADSWLREKADRGDIIRVVSAVGSFRPIGMVAVGSQVSGQVAEVLVDFNDPVVSGQTLARLDDQILIANLTEVSAARDVAAAAASMAEAATSHAESEVATAGVSQRIAKAEADARIASHEEASRQIERMRTLAGRNLISPIDLDRAEIDFLNSAAAVRISKLKSEAARIAIDAAEANLRVAKAQENNSIAVVAQREAALQRAKIELERATIRSPIDGFVVGKSVETGRTVSTSLEAPTLFTIAQDLRRMNLHVEIDEADIAQISNGQTAYISVDAAPDITFAGEVRQIRRLADSSQGVVTYTVVLFVENPDLILLPGMTSIVSIVTAESRDTLWVPNAALRFSPIGAPVPDLPAEEGWQFVWGIDPDGGAAPIAVRTGISDDFATEIVEGNIEPGRELIVGSRLIKERRGLLGLRFGL